METWEMSAADMVVLSEKQRYEIKQRYDIGGDLTVAGAECLVKALARSSRVSSLCDVRDVRNALQTMVGGYVAKSVVWFAAGRCGLMRMVDLDGPKGPAGENGWIETDPVLIDFMIGRRAKMEWADVSELLAVCDEVVADTFGEYVRPYSSFVTSDKTDRTFWGD